MQKRISQTFLLFATTLLAALPMCGQSASPSNNSPAGQGAPMHGGRQGGGEPCWEVAGIQKSAMEQIWSIERETHSQVESVCSNSSLTPQQKHEQVHELREQSHQKVDGLITPEQQKSLEACRQERGMEHRGGMHGEGGCGEGQGGQGWQHQGGSPNNSSPNPQGNGNRWNNSQSSGSSSQPN